MARLSFLFCFVLFWYGQSFSPLIGRMFSSLLFSSLLYLSLTSLVAGAPVGYMISCKYEPTDPLPSLYLVDMPNGQSFIGDTGSSVTISDIAFSPEGVLYAVDEYPVNNLYTCSLETGVCTVVGSGLGLGLTGGEGVYNQPGLAIDDEGVLWLTTYGATDQPASLYTIDPITGQATLVTALSGSPANIHKLTFGFGTLYGAENSTNSLVTVDRETGAVSFLGTFFGRDVVGLAFDENGLLWHVRRNRVSVPYVEVHAVDRRNGDLASANGITPYRVPGFGPIAFFTGGCPCSAQMDELLDNQQQILANQAEILANQES